MGEGFTVQKGSPLRKGGKSIIKAQDPISQAMEAYGYVESVINDCSAALKAIEAKDYDGAIADLESASSFLLTGLNILKYIGD